MENKGKFRGTFNDKFNNLKVKYKKDPKKMIVGTLGILLAFASLVGTSYAYLTHVSKTANNTVINAGNLALTFKNEANVITLDNALPQQDNDALATNTEYEFTIENTGSLPATYKITLDNTCTVGKSYTINGTSITADTCIPNEYIKVGIKEDGSDYKVLDYKTSNNNNIYIIEANILQENKTRAYKMKIWLDYDTPNTYNSKNTKNIIYSGKLGLSYEQGTKVNEPN